MKSITCDLLIIGGGINGCGIAAEAASRNLSVCLCEKSDLASGTSQHSTKLIHGGLRYLEQYQFNMVRHALIEREVLNHIAPHLIRPLMLIMIHESNMRPFWFIRLGLYIYDFITKTSYPKSSSLKRHHKPHLFSGLKTKINRGISFYDGQTIDTRLVIENALLAKQRGATILPRTQFITTQRNKDSWLSTLKSTNENTYHVTSRCIVNATGPWAEELNKKLNIVMPYSLTLVQGSHLVVPKLYQGEHGYLFQNKDNRVVFALPYHSHFTLIGTTDEVVTKPTDRPKITHQEIDYLLNLSQHYFDKVLSKDDIVYSYCGIRALVKDSKDTAQNISRNYKIAINSELAPILSVFGGKLTTYRKLAFEVIDRLSHFFIHTVSSSSHITPLPGAIQPQEVQAIKTRYSSLPPTLLNHYINLYGKRCMVLLGNTKQTEQLGQHFGGLLYQKEVEFLIKHEWATTAEDILWRRTKHGLCLTVTEKTLLSRFIQSVFFKKK